MNIGQSTIEKLLYYLLTMVFIAIIIVGFLAYQDGQAIKAQTIRIEQNQLTNSIAVKTYIACLLNLNPATTQSQIKLAEQVCFNNAPEVR